MYHSIKERLQEADIRYGADGLIPLHGFQTIMNDFDMPILLSDIEHFKDKNMLFTDALKNDFLKYKNLVNMVKPKE